MRKIARALTACLLILTMAFLAAGCGSSGHEAKRVDLIFSHSPERWQTGAKSMAEELTQQGYQVNLQIFSNEDEQKAAMKGAIDGKSSCIVLAGGNDKVIGDELKAAKDAKIPIIAYDSLVQNTDALSYYVTFDNEGIGASMGRYKDSDMLNYKCVRMIKAVVEGSQPDINDVKTYNNGVITVPSYLCIPQIIDKDNIDEVQ